ncbi:D-alanyl-D-alanine carboxypeptidase [Beauveria bassiana D1-5]|uniref:D-alanyl-D-alanine carboxypeptidase n=1 Tax=Beauveria bassiana D1-5 TaxID=1245745 RepID=A0A0A2VAI5_BEABA|nr:D-alanyl-D-alanine carboxypeptidase [Beauveria bassiana D1-5]
MALLRVRRALAVTAIIVAQAQDVIASSDQKPFGKVNDIPRLPLNEDFTRYVQESLDLWHVPGMSVGVVDGDNAYAEGYGYAVIPEVPATADTLWYGASTTKSQVAALLSHLINSGNHSASFPRGWETPVSSIIRDDFVMQDEWATAHVTLNDIVSHRSGLGRHDFGLLRVRDGKQLLPRDVTRNLRNLAMTAEPRVQWSYSNYMYIALGHVLETVTGQWLGHALRDMLWAPLGMDSTYFDLVDALQAPQRLAAGYVWDEATGNYTSVDYMNVTAFSAAGAVISNAKDYVKWLRCLLYHTVPLSEETHRDMQKPRIVLDENGGMTGDKMATTLYGLGCLRTMIHGKTVFFHPGGMHAYGTHLAWLPEIRFGVATFGNTAMTSNWQQLDVIYRLIEDKLGIATDERINIREISMKSRDEVMTRDKAISTLFPDRPDPPLPSTFNTDQLVGSYYNEGWGGVTFTTANDGHDGGKTILIGPRPHATLRHTFVLEHISGNYWLLKAVTEGGSPYTSRFFAARFVAGVNGKPMVMELNTAQGSNNPGDGIVVFTRTG